MFSQLLFEELWLLLNIDVGAELRLVFDRRVIFSILDLRVSPDEDVEAATVLLKQKNWVYKRITNKTFNSNYFCRGTIDQVGPSLLLLPISEAIFAGTTSRSRTNSQSVCPILLYYFIKNTYSIKSRNKYENSIYE